MEINNSKPKPCPFCGSKLLAVAWVQPLWGDEKKEATIVCNDCAASAPVYIWDTRIPSPADSTDTIVN
ncbi:hypothetical protein [Vibrio splendidus]|uniref:hypothetical protein n=1 Tax=Vibrio splendidus TaxID=29497 RepID=UPI0024699434|nr:hypothetical protein [Vibrio splendidus]MDH5917608.1 hypothetical protein [Vibrio splendidus]